MELNRQIEWPNRNLFLTVLGLNSISRWWQLCFLLRTLFLVYRQTPTCCLLCLYVAEIVGGRKLSAVSSYKRTNPPMKVPTLYTLDVTWYCIGYLTCYMFTYMKYNMWIYLVLNIYLYLAVLSKSAKNQHAIKLKPT